MSDFLIEEKNLGFNRNFGLMENKKSGIYKVVRILNKKIGHTSRLEFQHQVLSKHKDKTSAKNAFNLVLDKNTGKSISRLF